MILVIAFSFTHIRSVSVSVVCSVGLLYHRFPIHLIHTHTYKRIRSYAEESSNLHQIDRCVFRATRMKTTKKKLSAIYWRNGIFFFSRMCSLFLLVSRWNMGAGWPESKGVSMYAFELKRALARARACVYEGDNEDKRQRRQRRRGFFSEAPPKFTHIRPTRTKTTNKIEFRMRMDLLLFSYVQAFHRRKWLRIRSKIFI